jgi:hypothetical protein
MERRKMMAKRGEGKEARVRRKWTIQPTLKLWKAF